MEQNPQLKEVSIDYKAKMAELENAKNKIETGKKTIVLGLPNTGPYDYKTVAALSSFAVPKGYQLHLNLMANCVIHDAREKLAEYFLQMPGATHLLFIDADMVPEANTIMSLLSHDKDIVSAKFYKRSYPYQPCFYTKCMVNKNYEATLEGPMDPEAWPKEGAHEMEGVGMACTLIKREVFEKTPKPWFFPIPNVGEDLTFCMKARKAGFKIYTDFSLECGHRAEHLVTTATFTAAYKRWMDDPANKGKYLFA